VASVVVASCTGGDDTPASAPSPSATPLSGAAASPGETPSAEPGPSPDRLQTPATSSGPLTRADFPRPRSLGAGWAYAVDPGDAEEGYLGNGTPALERDPVEVAQLAVPFGCTRPTELAVPDHALEVDYTAGDVSVIAIRAAFPDAPAARSFFGQRADLLRRCQGTTVNDAEGRLVGTVRRLGATAVLSDRTPDSDPWTELGLHDGDQVVLLAARTSLGAEPMTLTQARTLARAFRR
jgi:hypothetical protein